MLLRWLFRLIRWAVGIAVVVVALLAAVVGVLALTNPSPGEAEGWERLADMPDVRGEVASAVVDDQLVVAGGLSGFGGTSDAVSVYDIIGDRWRRGITLPEARHHAAAATLGGRVYVSGGARGVRDWTPTATLWRSRPGAAWESMPAMPEGRQGHSMVSLDGRLYVVGGVGATNDTLIYDPDDGPEGAWSRGAPLLVGRDHLIAVAWRGEIWALGGRPGQRPVARVDIYDPERDFWREGPELPEPMSAMAAGVVDDVLHVVGGEDPLPIAGGITAAHYVLEAGTTSWTEGPDPVLYTHGSAYGTYEDALLVAGGAARQGPFSAFSFTGVTQRFGS